VTGLTLEAARRRTEDVLDDLRRGVDPKQKLSPRGLPSNSKNRYC
jgi:hypothetical protein